MTNTELDAQEKTKTDTNTHQFVCVHCPKGCVITITLPADVVIDEQTDISLVGHQCKHGKKFSRQELLEPHRILTTTVRVKDTDRMLPVRSAEPLPKARLDDVMRVLDGVEVETPVSCGNVILENVLDLGIDIVATWTVD